MGLEQTGDFVAGLFFLLRLASGPSQDLGVKYFFTGAGDISVSPRHPFPGN
jgi:hypothetical protein